ncbi:MAG TPA: ATP-binding protein [Thermomicrobiales bacterium]|nr:ATP-binding protein [Thermomicrobiales bacterium]
MIGRWAPRVGLYSRGAAVGPTRLDQDDAGPRCWQLSFPANFTLIAAMNPCPCGYFGDPRRACTCAPGAIGRYQKR